MTPPNQPAPQPPEPLTHILQALANTQPTPGLQSRLLQTLATHQAPSPTPHRPFRWLTAGALTLALAGLLLAIHFHMPVLPTGTQRRQEVRPELANATRQLAPATRKQQEQQAGTSTPNPPFALSSRRDLLFDHKRPNPTSAPPSAPQPTREPTPDNPAALALAEASAPSHPAPPIAVTPEERAFQRFISRHNAISLASLTPAAQLAREASDRRDFNAFFPPPPPPQTVNPQPPSTPPAAKPE